MKREKREYVIFMSLDKKIWPDNLHYFGVLLREGSEPVFQRRGKVMTFESKDKAEEYAQTHLRLPEVIEWRVEEFRVI